jgi:hypothetical protein
MKIRLRQAAPIAALLSLMASGSQGAVQLPGPDAPGLVAKAQGVSGLATAVSEGVQTNIASTADLGGPQMPGVRVVENVASVPEPAGWAMMLVGFGGLGLLLRRRRTGARTA